MFGTVLTILRHGTPNFRRVNVSVPNAMWHRCLNFQECREYLPEEVSARVNEAPYQKIPSCRSSPMPFQTFSVVVFTITHAWLSQKWRRKRPRVCHVKPGLITLSHPQAPFTEVLTRHDRNRQRQAFLPPSIFFLFRQDVDQCPCLTEDGSLFQFKSHFTLKMRCKMTASCLFTISQ